MTSGRRAAVLGGLSLVLGGLAASDIGSRETALRSRIGPTTTVLVARSAIPAGGRLTRGRLALRSVPARWAPASSFSDVEALEGPRVAVSVPAGADIVSAMLDDGRAGAPVRPGERVAELVAVGSAEAIVPRSRVDVVVTRADDEGGRTRLALEDVEVLAARPATEARSDDGAARVAVSLRVTVRQAVYLAAAQSFARELRLLPRAAGDDGRSGSGLSYDSGL